MNRYASITFLNFNDSNISNSSVKLEPQNNSQPFKCIIPFANRNSKIVSKTTYVGSREVILLYTRARLGESALEAFSEL